MPSDAHEGRRGVERTTVSTMIVPFVASKQGAAGSHALQASASRELPFSATATYLFSRVFFGHVAICRVYVPVFANTGFHDEAEIYQT